MISLIEKKEDQEYLSNLKNPFTFDSIYKIEIEIGKPMFKDYVSCVATVRFKNGETRASHKIENRNFAELVKQVEEFTNSLKPQL